ERAAPLAAARAEQVGGGEALLAHAARADPLLVPDVGDAALLADPGLVHEPQLDPLPRVLAREPLDQVGQSFLTRSCAFRSASGWIGLVFCQERSRPLSSRTIPLSP